MKTKNTLLLGACLAISTGSYAQTSVNPPVVKPILPRITFFTPHFRYDRFKRGERNLEDSLLKVKKREASLAGLLSGTKNLVTSENYSELVKKSYRSLSGNEVKQGKSMASSATVDEKSLTVNLAFKLRKHEFYIMPVFSAKSEDNLVGLFSEGSYSNTVSIGSNFSFLPAKNSSYFQPQARVILHNKLSRSDSAFLKSKVIDSTFFLARFDELSLAFSDPAVSKVTNRLLSGKSWLSDEPQIKVYKAAVDTLVGIGVLPAYFLQLNFADQKALLAKYSKNPRIADAVLKRHLDAQDARQMKGEFRRHFLQWVNFGGKLNSSGHKILDPAEDELTKTKNQYFFSGNVSWTAVWAFENGNRFYFSPTVNYSNEQDYSPALLLKADVLGTPFPVNATNTATPVKHRLEYYAAVVNDRLDNVTLDLPAAWYNTNKNFGVEIGAKLAPNDPRGNKLSARLGVFVPLNPGAESQVMIQPVINFTTLNDMGHFFEDHVVVGVNLSISFPKGLFKK